MDKEPLSFSNSALWKPFFKLVNQLWILRFEGSKTAAQLRNITNKNAVSLIVFSWDLGDGRLGIHDSSATFTAFKSWNFPS